MRSALRAWSRAEAVITLGLVSLVGSVASPRVEQAVTYLRYRVVMEDVASQIRSMARRSPAEQLRIDTARGVIHFVVRGEGVQSYEMIRRAIWLPAGLQFSEPAMLVTSSSEGSVASTSIIVAAPAYQRAFRITIHDGQVTLNEEPTS